MIMAGTWWGAGSGQRAGARQSTLDLCLLPAARCPLPARSSCSPLRGHLLLQDGAIAREIRVLRSKVDELREIPVRLDGIELHRRVDLRDRARGIAAHGEDEREVDVRLGRRRAEKRGLREMLDRFVVAAEAAEERAG